MLTSVLHLPLYLQKVREVLLGPGETLYLPSNIPHAVLNTEDNLSVTENYLATEGVMEVVHALVTGEDGMQQVDITFATKYFFFRQIYFFYYLKLQLYSGLTGLTESRRCGLFLVFS